jgi:hypothetical protein
MAMAAAVLVAGVSHAISSTPAAQTAPPPPQRSVSPDSNAYWGPRLWRILHILAEYSDRRDVSPLWLNLMRTTAQTMPCSKCRIHLTEYLRTHTMFRFTPLMQIKDIHTHIRRDLHTLHNYVNERNGAPKFDFAQLALTYGNKPRKERLYEVQVLYNELKNAWRLLVHTRIHPAAFSQWKQSLDLLIALIASGPHK